MDERDNKIRITIIPPERVAAFWPEAAPMLEGALNVSPGRATSDDLLHEINQGKQTLWGIFEEQKLVAAYTTKIYEAPRARVCCLEWIGGRGIEDWVDDGLVLLEKYARACGCQRLEFHGRKGWKKFVERHGWHFLSISYEKEL